MSNRAFKFLTATFDCFHKAENVKPLQIGIHKLVVIPPQSRITVKEIKQAFKCYTGTKAYRKAMIAGVERVGLNDLPCGEFVTDKQEAFAKTMLSRK